MEAPLRRLVNFALLGAMAGLVVWLVLDDSGPQAGFADIVGDGRSAQQRENGRARGPDVVAGPLVRRDHRPPRAPRVPATRPRLEIPAIDVRAHAIPLGRTASGALDVPGNWSVVGWWRRGAKPGEQGPAVLVGHVDSQTRPAIFHDLGELRYGDLIRFVPREGRAQEFVVVRKRRVSKRSFPTSDVYGETEAPTLRLVTCGGSFDWSRGHYRDNLIVFAEKI